MLKVIFLLVSISFTYFLSFTASGPAYAESASTSSLLEEIVVTARRREETAQEVPIPISAFSSEQLTERGITEIKNIEQITPNLDFQNSGVARGTAQIFLRGIGQVNWGPTQDPKVGTYVDGVYLGRPQGGVFDLFDVNRVEVLRGPQGTLFGRNTTAGLIQVITNNPVDTYEAKVQAGFGNDGQVSTDAVINVPIIDGVLAGRLAVQTRRDDGYMRDMSGRKWNETDSRSARGKLLWSPNDQLEIMLSGEWFSADESSGLGKCIGGVPGGAQGLNLFTAVFGRLDDLARACTANSDFYRSNDNDPNHSIQKVRGGTLNIDWDVAGMTFSSISAYREIDDNNGSWGWGTDFVGEPSNSIEVLGEESSPYEQLSQEFRISGSSMDDRLTWTAGIYGFRESGTSFLNVPFWEAGALGNPPPDPADAPLFYAPFFPGVTFGQFATGLASDISRRQELHATNKSWAVFAEGTYDVTDKLSITAGWRWTKDTRTFKRGQFTSDGAFDPTNTCPGNPVDPVTGAVTNSYCTQTLNYSEPTPRIIFNYNLAEDVMVYLSFSKGYSSGGMNGDIRMRPFATEISDNWEAGIKGRFFDGRLQFNGTVFRTDYENQQITVSRLINGQPTADLINAQKATLEGLEFDLVANPIANLFVTMSFGMIEGEYDEFTTIDEEFDPVTLVSTETINDFGHLEFIGGAPMTGSVNLAYQLNIDRGGSVTPSVGWSYRDRTYNTLRRLKSSRQGKYGILDARIVWALPNDRTEIAIWGTNLLDREYYRGALDLPNLVDADGNTTAPDGSPIGSDLGTTTIFPSEPMRMGITFTHRLGSAG